VLAELDRTDEEPVADGKTTLMQMAQMYGG
jgi:hypothetical protein